MSACPVAYCRAPAGHRTLHDTRAARRAWQEIAERHTPSSHWKTCNGCLKSPPCPDRQAADAALDRLDALWGTAASAEPEADR